LNQVTKENVRLDDRHTQGFAILNLLSGVSVVKDLEPMLITLEGFSHRCAQVRLDRKA
jgi:hypothetical protein